MYSRSKDDMFFLHIVESEGSVCAHSGPPKKEGDEELNVSRSCGSITGGQSHCVALDYFLDSRNELLFF